jgi:RNA polymerase sigma-70 factor (ECF subfamily)
MAAHDSKLARLPVGDDRFATTHWSMVVSAARPRGSSAARALATLCENYWFPLYAFVRRAGYPAHDAQDLTQEFFLRLLSENYLAAADPERGRFRSFLLGAMKHFLAHQRRSQSTQKRGGGRAAISLDFQSGEERYRLIEPADPLTPERLYEKRWALALLDLVLGRLREEFQAAGKLPLFDALKQFLAGRAEKGTGPICRDGPKGAAHKLDLSPFPQKPVYAELGEKLGMSEGAVKVAVHRLRRRYRELLKEEIARTIVEPDTVEDELQELLAALGPGK